MEKKYFKTLKTLKTWKTKKSVYKRDKNVYHL